MLSVMCVQASMQASCRACERCVRAPLGSGRTNNQPGRRTASRCGHPPSRMSHTQRSFALRKLCYVSIYALTCTGTCRECSHIKFLLKIICCLTDADKRCAGSRRDPTSNGTLRSKLKCPHTTGNSGRGWGADGLHVLSVRLLAGGRDGHAQPTDRASAVPHERPVGAFGAL